MRKFLSTFLSNEQIDTIEKAFKEKNPDAKDLPTYIPKSRFDEETAKRKEADNRIKDFDKEKATAISNATKEFSDKLKAIPEDWKTQLEQAQAGAKAQKTDYEAKIATLEKSNGETEKIYSAGPKNFKAVKALIDFSKPIDEELQRIKTSDPYLFNASIPKGTGRGDGEDGDTSSRAELNKMYAAVGLTPPQ